MIVDGAIVVDKPEGWTSHDVVAKMRGITRTKRIGHLGTLDPIATGVLPLVLEKATRLAQFYTRSDKIYEGAVRFGWSTNTYDRAGEPAGEKQEVQLDARSWKRCWDDFAARSGRRRRRYRRRKSDGKRAYDLARQAIAVELEPVRVVGLRADARERGRRRWRACGRTAREARTCARWRTIWAN